MQFWISALGNTASIAAENPVRLSVQAMKISSTPRFLSPLSTVAQTPQRRFTQNLGWARIFSIFAIFLLPAQKPTLACIFSRVYVLSGNHQSLRAFQNFFASPPFME